MSWNASVAFRAASGRPARRKLQSPNDGSMFAELDFGGHMLALDRREFIAALGGTAAVAHMWRTLANPDAPL
jgi:hypothetical protein